MLGRKSYTQEEVDTARAAIDGQLAGYRTVAGSTDVGNFEALFLTGLVVELDRFFVHRFRMVARQGRQPAERGRADRGGDPGRERCPDGQQRRQVQAGAV